VLHGAEPSFDMLAEHGPDGLCLHGEAYGTVSSTIVALDAGLGVSRYWPRPGQPCVTPTRGLTAAARSVLAAR
jgi:hypothetical protein